MGSFLETALPWATMFFLIPDFFFFNFWNWKIQVQIEGPMKLQYSKWKKVLPIMPQDTQLWNFSTLEKEKILKSFEYKWTKTPPKGSILEWYYILQLQSWKPEDNGGIQRKNYFQFKILYPENISIIWEGCRCLMSPRI